MELEQLACVVLVDPAPSVDCCPGAGRWRCGTAEVVEVDQHRGMPGGGDQQLLEPPQSMRTNGALEIVRREASRPALANVDVEVIRPEVDHHLVELSLAHHVAHDLAHLRLDEVAVIVEALVDPHALPLGDRGVDHPDSWVQTRQLERRGQRVAVRLERRFALRIRK